MGRYVYIRKYQYKKCWKKLILISSLCCVYITYTYLHNIRGEFCLAQLAACEPKAYNRLHEHHVMIKGTQP